MLDGTRLLAPKRVALMTADALPPGLPRERQIAALMTDLAPHPGDGGQGFARGFAVRTEPGRNPLPRLGRALLLGRHHPNLLLGRYAGAAIRDADGPSFPSARSTDRYRRVVQVLVYQALVA